LIGLENLERKASYPGKYTWIAPDAGSVFTKSDIAAVVRRRLNPPMLANSINGAGRRYRLVGDPERDFRGAAQQPGLGAACIDHTLDTNDALT